MDDWWERVIKHGSSHIVYALFLHGVVLHAGEMLTFMKKVSLIYFLSTNVTAFELFLAKQTRL